MAASANIDELLKQIPIGDIAEKFGVDEATANAAVQQALPGLLGGMAVNASSGEGAGKLEKALEKHTGSEAKHSLSAVDTADGEKIVNHVLGDKQNDVVRALGDNSGNSGIADLIPKLLPILAPIIMQFLANSMSGKKSDAGSDSQGGGIGDLLGGLLGGGGQSSGGGIGDLLGGLLGGGGGKSSGGGLGDLLGGILGGK